MGRSFASWSWELPWDCPLFRRPVAALRRPGPPARAAVPQAVEYVVERGQVEGYPTDSRQAIVSQTKSEGPILLPTDNPGVAGEAQIEQRGADHPKEFLMRGGSQTERILSRRDRLSAKIGEHAVSFLNHSVGIAARCSRAFGPADRFALGVERVLCEPSAKEKKTCCGGRSRPKCRPDKDLANRKGGGPGIRVSGSRGGCCGVVQRFVRGLYTVETVHRLP